MQYLRNLLNLLSTSTYLYSLSRINHVHSSEIRMLFHFVYNCSLTTSFQTCRHFRFYYFLSHFFFFLHSLNICAIGNNHYFWVHFSHVLLDSSQLLNLPNFVDLPTSPITHVKDNVSNVRYISSPTSSCAIFIA